MVISMQNKIKNFSIFKQNKLWSFKAKKVIKVVDENTDIVETKTELTALDKIKGVKQNTTTELRVKYENPDILYKVTNLSLNNKPIIVPGDLIETFIGSNNLEARNALINGENEVTAKDINGEPLYQIISMRKVNE